MLCTAGYCLLLRKERKIYMFEKKTVEIKSPDLKKMQEIIIDLRTRIYVPIEEDPQKARERYMTKFQTMKKF